MTQDELITVIATSGIVSTIVTIAHDKYKNSKSVKLLNESVVEVHYYVNTQTLVSAIRYYKISLRFFNKASINRNVIISTVTLFDTEEKYELKIDSELKPSLNIGGRQTQDLKLTAFSEGLDCATFMLNTENYKINIQYIVDGNSKKRILNHDAIRLKELNGVYD